MKVLMLSTDVAGTCPTSNTVARWQKYAAVLTELHVVVAGSGKDWQQGNLFVYPTGRAGGVSGWWHLGQRTWRLCRENLAAPEFYLSAQDPFEIGLIGWLIKIFFRLPLQLQVHTDPAALFFRQHNWKNRVRFFLAKFLLPRADSVRAVSVRVAAGLRKISPRLPAEKIFVLPVWFEQKNFVSPLGTHPKIFPFTFLMLTRLTTEKNIFPVVRAVQQLRKDFPHCGLVLVGDGPLAADLRLADGVRALGWVENPAEYLVTADVLVNNSWYEGYGRTLLEAATVGVPIVSTDVGIVREVVFPGENGLIITPGNFTELLNALRACLEKKFVWQTHLPQTLSQQEFLERFCATFL